jgi:hypothetical protein
MTSEKRTQESTLHMQSAFILLLECQTGVSLVADFFPTAKRCCELFADVDVCVEQLED